MVKKDKATTIKSVLRLDETKAIARVSYNGYLDPYQSVHEKLYEFYIEDMDALDEGRTLAVVGATGPNRNEGDVQYKLVYIHTIVPVSERKHVSSDLKWIVDTIDTKTHEVRLEKQRRKGIITDQLDRIAKDFEREHTLQLLLKDVPEAQALLEELKDLS